MLRSEVYPSFHGELFFPGWCLSNDAVSRPMNIDDREGRFIFLFLIELAVTLHFSSPINGTKSSPSTLCNAEHTSTSLLPTTLSTRVDGSAIPSRSTFHLFNGTYTANISSKLFKIQSKDELSRFIFRTNLQPLGCRNSFRRAMIITYFTACTSAVKAPLTIKRINVSTANERNCDTCPSFLPVRSFAIVFAPLREGPRHNIPNTHTRPCD